LGLRVTAFCDTYCKTLCEEEEFRHVSAKRREQLEAYWLKGLERRKKTERASASEEGAGKWRGKSSIMATVMRRHLLSQEYFAFKTCPQEETAKHINSRWIFLCQYLCDWKMPIGVRSRFPAVRTQCSRQTSALSPSSTFLQHHAHFHQQNHYPHLYSPCLYGILFISSIFG
jgi:hypothetical protein